MGKKSRDKGATYEREVVNAFKAHGIDAVRLAPLQSDLRRSEYADVDVQGLGRVECKRPANGFKMLYDAIEHAEAVCLRSDGEKSLIVLRLDHFLAEYARRLEENVK